MGRHTEYDEPLTHEICERIANGEPLRQICREEGMPAWTTVYKWINANPEFRERFARARDLGHDAIAEEALEIADTPLTGEELEIADDGKTKVKRADMLGHRKLQIETRLKLLAKWNPKKYGEKVQIGGADDLPAIKTDSTMTPSEAYQRLING